MLSVTSERGKRFPNPRPQLHGTRDVQPIIDAGQDPQAWPWTRYCQAKGVERGVDLFSEGTCRNRDPRASREGQVISNTIPPAASAAPCARTSQAVRRRSARPAQTPTAWSAPVASTNPAAYSQGSAVPGSSLPCA